jgi:flagellar biosynthesis protein
MKSVALKYISGLNKAPEVIASAEGILGDLIYSIAQKNQVPIVKNPQLADLLNKVPVGNEIPDKLFIAVAEIYSFIWNLENKK